MKHTAGSVYEKAVLPSVSMEETLMMMSSNGNIFRVTEFPAQRPVTRMFGVFFDLHLIERLSKHS